MAHCSLNEINLDVNGAHETKVTHKTLIPLGLQNRRPLPWSMLEEPQDEQTLKRKLDSD
jgi:hypothetical protein